MSTVQVYSPIGTLKDHRSQQANLADKKQYRLAILDNGKSNAVEIMVLAVDYVNEVHGDVFTGPRVFRKQTASQPVAEDILRQITTDADIVLTGSGD